MLTLKSINRGGRPHEFEHQGRECVQCGGKSAYSFPETISRLESMYPVPQHESWYVTISGLYHHSDCFVVDSSCRIHHTTLVRSGDRLGNLYKVTAVNLAISRLVPVFRVL